MATNYVSLSFGQMYARVELTPELQELWNKIQFYEETNEYEQYDDAWSMFLDLTRDTIATQLLEEMYVVAANEYRG